MSNIANKLVRIAENERKIYDKGYEIGHAEGDLAGYDKGYAQSNTDFWNGYAEGVNRTTASYKYAGVGWNDNTFYPPAGVFSFRNSALGCFQYSLITDLKGRLEECETVFDFSKCTNVQSLFSFARVTHISEINCTNSSNLQAVFSYCSDLVSIYKLVLKDDGSQTFVSTFNNCSKLQDVLIEGKIGRDFDIKTSPLTVASAKSIINALVNYAGTTNEYKYTLYFKSDVWTALEADSTAPTGDSWQDYVFSLGWNT